MQQLGILDTAFVNLESNNAPQHIASFGIYDPATAPEHIVRYKSLIKTFDRRLKHLPLFRTRLVNVPGGLDRPYWVKDAGFDLEFHIRHIRLPEPGDWRQLCISLARLHARPLDMSRPLWEMYVIEGLDRIKGVPKGCFGIYIKIHHALLDGGAIEQIVSALHDLTPTPPRDKHRPDKILVDSKPSSLQMLSRAAINNVKNGFSMGRGAVRTGGQLAKVAYRVARKKMPRPVMGGPETRFNQPVGPHRVFAATSFKLDEIKAIKQATGTTINDVCVAIVSGALRRYLFAQKELPQTSLVAIIPVSARVEKTGDTIGNRVAAQASLIHSDIEEPLERLQAIAQSLTEIKQYGVLTPIAKTYEAAGMVNPLLVKSAVRFYQRQKLTRYSPAKVSTVISNMSGAQVPLYAAGAQLLQTYSLGFLSPGIGLFHAITSYMEGLSISVTADRDQLPDPDSYARCLEESYKELAAAVRKTYSAAGVVAKPAKPKTPAQQSAKSNSIKPDTARRRETKARQAKERQAKESRAKPRSGKPRKASLRPAASSGAYIAGLKARPPAKIEKVEVVAPAPNKKTPSTKAPKKRAADQRFRDLVGEPKPARSVRAHKPRPANKTTGNTGKE